MNKENIELQEQIILAVNLLKERQDRIDKAIEQLEELKNLYDDNYTVSDKAENILNILRGE